MSKVRKEQAFGAYRLLGEQPYGRGGMSDVWRALNTKNEVVAVAILQRRHLKWPNMRRRFLRAAQHQPIHPNIVRILDTGGELPANQAGEYGLDNLSVPFYVMQFVDGQSLADMVASDRHGGRSASRVLSAAEAYRVLRSVAYALDAVHLKGLVHRDIKPGNILVSGATGNVLLSDFGIAEYGTGIQNTRRKPVGTPQYMAPEQWDETQDRLGPACDIHALGVSMYELLSGRLPYAIGDTGSNSESPLGMPLHFSEAPIALHKIAPLTGRNVSDIVMRAMSQDPSKRYPTASAFAQAYQQALVADAPDGVDARLRIMGRPEPARRLAQVMGGLSLLTGLLAAGLALLTLAPAGMTSTPQTAVSSRSATVQRTSVPALLMIGTSPVRSEAMLSAPADPAVPTIAILPPLILAATSTPSQTPTTAPTPTRTDTATPNVQALATATSARLAVPTAVPAEPTIVPVALAAQLEARGLAGYEPWGGPGPVYWCEQLESRRFPSRRFKLPVRIVNTGQAVLEAPALFIMTDDGREYPACQAEAGAYNIRLLQPGGQLSPEISGYFLERVKRIELRTNGGVRLAALCMQGLVGSVC